LNPEALAALQEEAAKWRWSSIPNGRQESTKEDSPLRVLPSGDA
jgi:hypothetical protein